MPAVAKQVVDAFIRDAEVHAVLVWAGVTLGGEGFLSTAVAFHFPPGLGRLFGLWIILFVFLNPAEGTIVSRSVLERAGCFWFLWRNPERYVTALRRSFRVAARLR